LVAHPWAVCSNYLPIPSRGCSLSFTTLEVIPGVMEQERQDPDLDMPASSRSG
jgi:hypothetical protein